MKFKVGDKVRCIDGPTKGAGWKKGLTFIVTRTSPRGSAKSIYWGGVNGCGVYQDSIELVNTDWDE